MIPQDCFLFARSDVSSTVESQLFGYGLSNDAIIFGTEGIRSYLGQIESNELPTEGRFCGIFIEGNSLIIRTDRTGQEMLYLFQKDGDWAVSNSFMLLAANVAKTHQINFNPIIAKAFHLAQGTHIGEQLISHNTMIKEISVVPLTWELKVDRTSGSLSFLKETYLSRYALPKGSTYEDTLLDVVQRGAGMLAILHEHGIALNTHLSGGYDSRLVLCMMIAGQVTENVRITSYEYKSDDFKVAYSICKQLSLPLNTPGPVHRKMISSSEALKLYLLSCGGTYLPIYLVKDYQFRGKIEAVLTGDQPTGWSFFAGNAMFNGDADKIAEGITTYMDGRGNGDDVRDEFLTTFEMLGIDKNHPAAMLAHYNAIRSRHHCGRNWYKSSGAKLLFTPLMQSSFIALDLYNLENGYHPTKLFVDAFSAFGGWALNEPFETPDRDFDPILIENSPFRGGVEIIPHKYSIFGKIETEYPMQEPDIFDIPLELGYDDELVKKSLEQSFLRATLAKNCSVFTSDDFNIAKQEIHQNGSFSQGYRKLAHILSVDMVLRIIQTSVRK